MEEEIITKTQNCQMEGEALVLLVGGEILLKLLITQKEGENHLKTLVLQLGEEIQLKLLITQVEEEIPQMTLAL